MSEKGLRILANPANRQLIREFLDNPLARHRPAVKRVADAARELPARGKHVLVRRSRGEPLRLGRLTGRRGDAVEVLDDQTFHTVLEAERVVLTARLAEFLEDDLESKKGG